MNTLVANDLVKAEPGSWRAYAEGVAWGTVVLFGFVVVAYLALVFVVMEDLLALPVVSLLATVLLYMAFTVMHEAGHGNIAHEVSWMKPWERIMGWAVTLPFLIVPFSMFAKIHDYHHAFTNDPDRDPDHWVVGDTWKQASFRALTLPLHYIYLTVTRFRKDPVLATTHRSSLVYYIFTLSMVSTVISLGYIQELIFLGIIPIFLSSFVLGMLFDWIPHTPTRNQGAYQNTRTYLFPGLKYLTMGQSYHHIHHLYPRVSWYHYARVFARVRPELERNQAPIEHLLGRKLPGFGQSPSVLYPTSHEAAYQLTLKVEAIRQETKDARVITFANLSGKCLPFQAGQYITVSKLIKGERVTRCYSICEAPSANTLSIGVKRVAGGVMSNYINDVLRPGDELSIAGPFGDFVYDYQDPQIQDCITLFAGGSGITPIIAIAKAALAANTRTQVYLVYANRSRDELMFARDIAMLGQQYAERFQLVEIFQQADASWQGLRGYLQSETLSAVLLDPELQQKGLFYICGPEKMKQEVQKGLEQMNLGSEQVFIEEFVQQTAVPKGEVYEVKLGLANDKDVQLCVAENQTILQAAKQQGLTIPHACGTGQCGCCMMKIEQGQGVLMNDDSPGLLEGEKAQGYTLTCQCRPQSDMCLSAASK